MIRDGSLHGKCVVFDGAQLTSAGPIYVTMCPKG